MEQRTEEWYQARLGKVGASCVSDACATIKTGEAATRKSLRAKLIAERLTQKSTEGFMSAAMQHGTEYEPVARALYEVSTGAQVDEVGWIEHPHITNTGASPDGLVGTAGLIEIKCPNTATHIEYLLGGIAPAEYRNQMLWQMECTKREWCDFVSYDPRMPEEMQLFVVRYERDDEKLSVLRAGVIKFLSEVDETIVKLSNATTTRTE